tara:strand:- start:400 stop:1605 length:1206 start_codon:yes stop_codon:yes gene_type:complete
MSFLLNKEKYNFFLIILIFLFFSYIYLSDSFAADNAALERLREIERAINENKRKNEVLKKTTAELNQDIRELRSTLIESASKTIYQEQLVTNIEQKISQYKTMQKNLIKNLEQKKSTINYTIISLQKLSRIPKITFIWDQENLNNYVHRSILLASIMPQLYQEAEILESRLTAIKNISTEILNQKNNLNSATTIMERERIALDRLIRRKAALRQKTINETKETKIQITKLAKSARDLRSLLESLNTNEKKRKSIKPTSLTPKYRPFSVTKGRLPMPTGGIVTKYFGEIDDMGLISRGITIRTRDFARVIAPHDGQIVFAGPFRKYGKLLIISHGEEYHTLLAGFASLNVIVGQWILAGEPVGTMGKHKNEQKQYLYLELRHKGNPVDPSYWLSISNIKVSK